MKTYHHFLSRNKRFKRIITCWLNEKRQLYFIEDPKYTAVKMLLIICCFYRFALWCSPILLVLHVMTILAVSAFLSFNNNIISHYILGALYGLEVSRCLQKSQFWLVCDGTHPFHYRIPFYRSVVRVIVCP